MAQNVGYEIDKLLVDPVEYWVHRIVKGRRVAKAGPYATEDEALRHVESQLEDDNRRNIEETTA